MSFLLNQLKQASIAALKQRVSVVSGVPPNRQRLIFRGRVLAEDEQPLRNVLGFNSGDAMHMVTGAPPPQNASAGQVGTQGTTNSTTQGHVGANSQGNTTHTTHVASGSLSVPAHALGSLDIPGVVNALLLETQRDLAAAGVNVHMGLSVPGNIVGMMGEIGVGGVGAGNQGGVGAVFGSIQSPQGQPVSNPHGSNATSQSATNASYQPTLNVSAYADPTATALRHATFVLRLAREIEEDPFGVSRGDGTGGTVNAETNGGNTSGTRTGTSTSTSPCTHFGVQCDTCGVVPIVGVRYKSTTRADYDLCDTCHGAASRGVPPAEGPFVSLASPLPGLVPPPTAAPAALLSSETRENTSGPATEMERHVAAMRRRMPPVMTTVALAEALENACGAVRAALPGIEAAAMALRGVNEESTSTTESITTASIASSTPSPPASSTQGQVLRTSMALHASGSLLMELARLASSVQVTGSAAPAPEFIRSGAAAMESSSSGRSGTGSGTDSTAATQSGASATSPQSPLGFLAPPLVYLDPRGGTQPLSGLGARQSVLGGMGVRPGAGVHFGGMGAQRPSPATTAAAAPTDGTAQNGANPAPTRLQQTSNNPAPSVTVNSMQTVHRQIQQLHNQIHQHRHETQTQTAWLRQQLGGGNRQTRPRNGPLSGLRNVLRFVFRRGPFRERDVSLENFPERAAGTAQVAERVSGVGVPRIQTRGTGAPSVRRTVPPAPASTTPPAPPPPSDANAARRSTFNFRFDTNVRVVPNGHSGHAAGQGAAPQGAPQDVTQTPQPQPQAQPQAQTNAQPNAPLPPAAHQAAHNAAHNAMQASFTQGIGALLNHLQQSGNVASGSRMHLVPTAEGGFMLEPMAGEGVASGTATSNGTVPPVTGTVAPTTPTQASPNAVPTTNAVPVVTPTATPTAPTATATPAPAPATPTPVSSRGTGTTTSAAATSTPAGGVGLGLGLPERRAPRDHQQRKPNELPRQDSLD